MAFEQNEDLAFAVVTRRQSGDETPKVAKIVGDILTLPEEAKAKASELNKSFDASGKKILMSLLA